MKVVSETCRNLGVCSIGPKWRQYTELKCLMALQSLSAMRPWPKQEVKEDVKPLWSVSLENENTTGNKFSALMKLSKWSGRLLSIL